MKGISFFKQVFLHKTYQYFIFQNSRKRCLHSSSLVLSSAGNNHTGGQFWERSLRGKYDQSKSKITLPPRSQRIREGLKELKKEIQIWKNEVVDAVQLDPVLTLPAPGVNHFTILKPE